MILSQSLSQFESMSIESLMDRAELMDRTDRKFVFHRKLLSDILNDCANEYRILEMQGQRMFEYETEYFDTPERLFYFQHHRGLGNRYKVRRRLYGGTGEEFIEVKHKTHKGNTQKLRVAGRTLSTAELLLHEHIGPSVTKQLQPSLLVRYTRITLLHKQKNEKVTLDFGITWGSPPNEAGSGLSIPFDNLIIAEVKSTNLHFNTFQGIAKNLGIREGSLSKYCLGTLAVYPGIKQNQFKQTYNHILSIEHA